MRHRKQGRLSGPKALRKAQIRSLIRALFIYEKIKTTTRKAKLVSSKAEELITLAKRQDLHSKRIAYSLLQDHKLVKKLFEDIAIRFKDKPGGYTRLMNLGFRKGDGAEMSLVELTVLKEKEKKKKPKEKEEATPTSEHKPSLKEAPKKTLPPKGGLRHTLRRIFKKERDAL